MGKTRIIVSGVYVVDNATKEETHITGEMVFGRADCHKNFPQDSLISRRHFRLVPSEDVVLIEDLGSTNRTKVNNKLLKASTLYKLKSRDNIEFGKQSFQIFIDGKILGQATEMVSKSPDNLEAVEQSLIFERIATNEQGGEGLIIHGVEGLDIQSDSDKNIATKKDDAVILNLITKKHAAWYLQFGGSEFGPLSLKELKVVVKSKQFQGGVLFAFTEGLADWIPVDKLLHLLDDKLPEFTATHRVAEGVPLSGKVTIHLRNASLDRFSGKLETIALSELVVQMKDEVRADSALIELEVEPDPKSTIEPFKATVKIDKSRSSGNHLTLVIVQATPRTKMSIERFIRSKS